jgi:hypothetical protein
MTPFSDRTCVMSGGLFKDLSQRELREELWESIRTPFRDVWKSSKNGSTEIVDEERRSSRF